MKCLLSSKTIKIIIIINKKNITLVTIWSNVKRDIFSRTDGFSVCYELFSNFLSEEYGVRKYQVSLNFL